MKYLVCPEPYKQSWTPCQCVGGDKGLSECCLGKILSCKPVCDLSCLKNCPRKCYRSVPFLNSSK